MDFNTTQYQELDCRGRAKCFDTLTSDELEALEQAKLIVRYKKGEVIAKQGTSHPDILFLQNGYVKFYKEYPTTRTLTFIEKKCNFIGLFGLFVDTVKQYTLVAHTDCVVCSFSKSHIEKLISKNNEFAVETIKNINDKTLHISNILSNGSSKQMHGRMAWALLELSVTVFETDKLKSLITRKDIAEFTNMSVMSVGRILREFAEEGLIELGKDFINIIEKEKIITICKNG
ncbi:MAG: Crp/Fnr family transcriptional regulator [Flavobacteriales bacterium]|nr:Crp/Fnr family transcriptional regulator [Flavobacteriales bacterium]